MTFEIYLPRSDRPTTNEAPAEERVRGGSERILITEDETFLAYLWEKMLQGPGYSVVSTRTGTRRSRFFGRARDPSTSSSPTKRCPI